MTASCLRLDIAVNPYLSWISSNFGFSGCAKSLLIMVLTTWHSTPILRFHFLWYPAKLDVFTSSTTQQWNCVLPDLISLLEALPTPLTGALSLRGSILDFWKFSRSTLLTTANPPGFYQSTRPATLGTMEGAAFYSAQTADASLMSMVATSESGPPTIWQGTSTRSLTVQLGAIRLSPSPLRDLGVPA